MHAQIVRRDLERAARAGRGLFKYEGHALAFAELVRNTGLFLGLELGGQVYEVGYLLAAVVQQFEKVASFEVHCALLSLCAGGLNYRDGLLYQLHRYVQRGQQAQLAVRCEHKHTVFAASRDDVVQRLYGLYAEHQSQARYALNAFRACERVHDVLALGLDLRQQAVVNAREDIQRSGADGGVAAECRTVAARRKRVFALFAHEAGADGQSPRPGPWLWS